MKGGEACRKELVAVLNQSSISFMKWDARVWSRVCGTADKNKEDKRLRRARSSGKK